MDQHQLFERIKIWEEGIRQGKFSFVRDEILQQSMSKFPRALVASVASTAYRVGLSYWALRLLSPLIKPEKPIFPVATPEEKMAYAAALFRVGVTQEAFDLLREVNWMDHPTALLHQAYGNFKLWEYQASVGLLKKFLIRTSPDQYQYVVGQVNLVAAWIVVEDYDSAETLVQEVLKKTSEKNFHLLHGNALELVSQIRILQKNYESAETYLKLSKKRLSTAAGAYSFFVKKWQTISYWLQVGPNEKSQQALDLLRAEAIGMRHWETLRDCDYYQALKTKDPSLITQLCFGTPYPGYRRRLRKKFGSQAKMKGSYFWNLGSEFSKSKAGVILDPHSSRWITESAHSELPKGLREALMALCKDFYRPLPQGEFFTEVFPGEYFNPFTSPSRLELIVRRLHRWLSKNQIPLQIEVINKEYRLLATGACAIKVFRRQKMKSRYELLLRDLRSEMKHKSFKIAEASIVLGVSLSTVQRVLKAGLESQKLYKSERGPACRYRFQK